MPKQQKRQTFHVPYGVTWRDGRLAAHTLHAVLRDLGLDPDAQRSYNLWGDDGAPDALSLGQVQTHAAAGRTVVALGRRVQRQLTRAGVPHIPLVHPAARGRIRLRARSQARVAEALGVGRG